ncbi:MAG: CHASE2 domain-containing protein [Armatimonadetes bacterium]|nr:CHASE2 domain-containing protein [Armatimonadota bacterium]
MSVPPPVTNAPGVVAQLLSRRFLSAGMGAVAALVCALLPFTDAGERTELRTHDARFALRERFPRPRDKKAARIVLVTAQTSTLAAWQEPTLFWGARYAQVITVARKHGAKVIGVDSVFAASAGDALAQMGLDGSLAPDESLAGAIENADGSVVLAFLLGTGSEPPILPAPRFLMILALENRLGFIDLEPAADYAIRTARPRVRGKSGDESVTASSSAATLAQTASPQLLPDTGANRDTPFYINYTGRDFPTIPAERVASDTLTAPERASLRGSIVIIAKDYAPSLDRHVSSGGRVMSGAAIHAETLATLLDKLPLAAVSGGGRGNNRCGFCRANRRGGVAQSFGAARARVRGRRAVSSFCRRALDVFQRGRDSSARRARAGVCFANLADSCRPLGRGSVRPSVYRSHIRQAHFACGARLPIAYAGKPTARRQGIRRDDCVFRYSRFHRLRRDPRPVVRDFNDLYTVAIAAIESHGGLGNRFLGDGFLAV